MTDNTINPIIPGFAPDPSLVLVHGTYFLVNSTFHLFPGLPIYTSKNLRDWKHIGDTPWYHKFVENAFDVDRKCHS
jgi:beta-xylosidase